MRKPWFREFNDTWYVQVGRKQIPLGKDPHGKDRKNPPKEVVDAWHALERQKGHVPADPMLSELIETYLGVE